MSRDRPGDLVAGGFHDGEQFRKNRSLNWNVPTAGTLKAALHFPPGWW